MPSERWSRRELIARAAFVTATGCMAGASAAARPAAAASAATQPAKVAAFSPLVVDTAVVLVHVRRMTGPNSAVAQTGTGVVLSSGRVVTAKHLFKDAWNDVEIIFGGRNGRSEQKVVWTGEPLHIDDRDVTILSGVRAPDWVNPAKLSAVPVKVGDALVSVGLSRPGRPRIRGGVVDSIQASGAIAIDVNSSEGDSGGPTFNQNNEVVGIHNGVETRTWEGSWGKRVDIFSLTIRITDLPQLKKSDKPEKKP